MKKTALLLVIVVAALAAAPLGSTAGQVLTSTGTAGPMATTDPAQLVANVGPTGKQWVKGT